MSATETALRTNGRANALTKFKIVDCDVHHSPGKGDALYSYMPRHFVEYIKDFGTMMPRLGYTNMPGGGARKDLWWIQSKIPPISHRFVLRSTSMRMI